MAAVDNEVTGVCVGVSELMVKSLPTDSMASSYLGSMEKAHNSDFSDTDVPTDTDESEGPTPVMHDVAECTWCYTCASTKCGCSAGEAQQESRDRFSGECLEEQELEFNSSPYSHSEQRCEEEASVSTPVVTDTSASEKADVVGEAEAEPTEEISQEEPLPTRFLKEETFLIFDWDDTILPSTWVQHQGLRLDEGSEVSEWQHEQLAEVAVVAIETLRIAKQFGTVVLVTNAERGWIELSCQKFMPSLYSSLDGLRVLSARTTYESDSCPSPLDWKLKGFEAEIRRFYGPAAVNDGERRKNVLSLGDSAHEREALLRCCAPLPNCRSKSLKFVERPDLAQLCKQHSLVSNCFDRIVHHDGNLDLCIRCA